MSPEAKFCVAAAIIWATVAVMYFSVVADQVRKRGDRMDGLGILIVGLLAAFWLVSIPMALLNRRR